MSNLKGNREYMGTSIPPHILQYSVVQLIACTNIVCFFLVGEGGFGVKKTPGGGGGGPW